jgi:hypothetical protein
VSLAIVLGLCVLAAIGVLAFVWMRRPARRADPARWPATMTTRTMERRVTAWLEGHGWKVHQRQFGVVWAAKEHRLASVRCYAGDDTLLPGTVREWGRSRGEKAWAEICLVVRMPSAAVMEAADNARVTIMPYTEIGGMEPIVFRYIAEAVRGRVPRPPAPG